MKKLLFLSVLVLFACATANNLSQDEIVQLEEHSEEVQEKIEGTKKEEVLPDDKKRVWSAPNYANQINVPGYDATTFAIPLALKDRVNFWIDIYTKYTTSQGVLHDSRYATLVYEPIDFAHLDNDKSLTTRQRFKAEKKYLDERKIISKKFYLN